MARNAGPNAEPAEAPAEEETPAWAAKLMERLTKLEESSGSQTPSTSTPTPAAAPGSAGPTPSETKETGRSDAGTIALIRTEIEAAMRGDADRYSLSQLLDKVKGLEDKVGSGPPAKKRGWGSYLVGGWNG